MARKLEDVLSARAGTREERVSMRARDLDERMDEVGERPTAAPPARTIAEAILVKVRRSRRNIFVRRDFEKLGSYAAIGRALRRAAASGNLVRIGYGRYAKAERSPVTGCPASVIGIRRLASEALSRLGKRTAASSFDDAYNRGRSSQVPTGRVIQVKGRVRRRIGYDGHYVVFERAR